MMSRLHAIVIALFLCWLVGASSTNASCRDPDVAGNFSSLAYAAAPDATIEYFGHNFFQITSSKGTKIITDPLAPGMHATPVVTPHVVTVGREHPNHNYVELAR
ncbi:MAG TPA: MBL fold metallo-hydrolase, partial [Candidatus Acidoferrum sp.]|nr:MBL fold metallo-hydrolase [Candidatus Acidoferrum sp.]